MLDRRSTTLIAGLRWKKNLAVDQLPKSMDSKHVSYPFYSAMYKKIKRKALEQNAIINFEVVRALILLSLLVVINKKTIFQDNNEYVEVRRLGTSGSSSCQ